MFVSCDCDVVVAIKLLLYGVNLFHCQSTRQTTKFLDGGQSIVCVCVCVCVSVWLYRLHPGDTNELIHTKKVRMTSSHLNVCERQRQ